MKKYKGKYRLKSARLEGWDYSNNGAYFITICTQNRRCFFGKIIDRKIYLSKKGQIINKNWQKITKQFPFVKLDEFVVMPNHVHGILCLNGAKKYRFGGRNTVLNCKNNGVNCRYAINRVSTIHGNTKKYKNMVGGATKKYNPMGKKTVGEIIRWFKGRCSYEIRKSLDDDFAWQPRFYDRIVRNEAELIRIRRYIRDNCLKWGQGV